MSGKFALIIGNTEYTDPGLAQLTAPGKDAEDFARVLKDQDIGAFDNVKILLNQLSSTVSEAIDEFFDLKKPDDLLVLYFSGHGVRDELGALYLAVKNTIRSRLRSTAVKSDYIREAMDQCRSKRQVLILDCCNSGAVAQGTKAATGVSIGTASAFESGYGRIILTASDSTQFAWEGDKVIGETDNSLFTHYLVEGLKGEADQDGDGRITVDELYDYAYEKVRFATPKQTPSKFSSKQQGEIILRHSTRIEDIKPVPLPASVLQTIEDPISDIRLGGVQYLIKLLNGKNLGLARSAREALERIAKEDDSYSVRQAAIQAPTYNFQPGQPQSIATPSESKAASKNLQPHRFPIWTFAAFVTIALVVIAIFVGTNRSKNQGSPSPGATNVVTKASVPINSPAPSQTSVPPIEPPSAENFQDDFVGQLAEGWTWLEEVPTKWSLSNVAGSLQIMTSDASFDGAYLPLNILLRDAPTGDFEITTSLRFTPTSNYQVAGLVVFQDQGDVLQLGRAFCDRVNSCVGDGVYFDNFENGSVTESNYNTPFQGSVIYLRLRREGNTYTGYYSADGQNWTISGEHLRDFSQERVGLVAAQAGTEIPAVFDYFTMKVLKP